MCLCVCSCGRFCVSSRWRSFALHVILRYGCPTLFRRHSLCSLFTSCETAELFCFCRPSFSCCSLTLSHFPFCQFSLFLFFLKDDWLVYTEPMLAAFDQTYFIVSIPSWVFRLSELFSLSRVSSVLTSFSGRTKCFCHVHLARKSKKNRKMTNMI